MYLFRDRLSFCYCVYVLRISRFSGFLRAVPTNTRIFFARFITMWETQIIPRHLGITTPFRKYSRFSVWIPVAFAKTCFSRMVIDAAKILLYHEVPSLKKHTTNLQSFKSDFILIFLCKTPSNLCDVLEVKRQDDHHYHRRQHHHYCRHHYHRRIMIIIIIIIMFCFHIVRHTTNARKAFRGFTFTERD